MAVVENGSSSRNFETQVPDSHVYNDLDESKDNNTHLGMRMAEPNNGINNPIVRTNNDQSFHQFQRLTTAAATTTTATSQTITTTNNHKPPQRSQVQHNQDHHDGAQNLQMVGGYVAMHQQSNGVEFQRNGDGSEGFKREIRVLEELFSKLNPMAEEFVPPSLANHFPIGGDNIAYTNNINNFIMQANSGNANGHTSRRKKNNYSQVKRRMNSRTSMAQREEVIRRTVYVSDIDQQVTEEQLAALFINCGQVVDCRVCGDPNSVLRFAFVEFTDEEGARAALSLAGTMLGFYPVRVLPSKTAIAPVNPTFLPRSEDEREMCARTIYCTNIDKKVTQADVKLFFESICGEVYRLRLLGDYHHSTRIAFVEFIMAESAIAALNCSGAVLGSLPIRVSPSKTPVRPRAPRPPLH